MVGIVNEVRRIFQYYLISWNCMAIDWIARRGNADGALENSITAVLASFSYKLKNLVNFVLFSSLIIFIKNFGGSF